MPDLSKITVSAPGGVPEVRQGDDLAALLLPLIDLRDGDILVVTSKIVSKAEGRVVTGDREFWIDSETTRLVARRGATRIVRNRLGLTMAAAGIDNSNVEAGSIVLLPIDPDGSARELREAAQTRLGVNVGVVVTDTAGRPWRDGQTDIAIGAAGISVLESFAGQVDAYGNPLAVTAPAVADEIAGAAELAQGKLGARPYAVLRGRGDLVLPIGEHGTGARVLIRDEGADMFGFGSREAVVAAVGQAPEDAVPFGATAPVGDVATALVRAGITATIVGENDVRCPPDARVAASIVAFAHRWEIHEDGTDLQLRPLTP